MEKRQETDRGLKTRLKEWLQTHGRRSGKDRRSWKPTPAVPFKDQHGSLVTKDRRKLPERRLSNIEVAVEEEEQLWGQ